MTGARLTVIAVLLMRVAGAFINLLFVASVTANLDLASAGYFLLAINVFGFAALLARLGLDNSLLFVMPKALKDFDRHEVGMFLAVVLGIVLLGSTLTALVGSLLLRTTLAAPQVHEVPFLTPLALGIVAGTAASALLGSMLRAVGSVYLSAMMQSVATPTYAVLLLLLLPEAGLSEYLLAYAAACVLSPIIGLVRLARLGLLRAGRPAVRTTRLLAARTGLPAVTRRNMATDLLQNGLIAFAPLFLLSCVAPPEDVAVFGVALRVVAVLGFIPVAVSFTISQDIAHAFHHGRPGEALAAARRGGLLNLALLLPGTLAVLLAAPLVLSVFSVSDPDATLTLRLLLVPSCVAAMVGPVATLLLMTHNERFQLLSVACSAALLVPGILLLGSAFGLIGAALAWALATSAFYLMSFLLASRVLGYRSTVSALVARGTGP